jgi:predicted ATPase
LESPLVGREAEFGALQGALDRLQAGVGGIVTIVGQAGIGKSRLVAELREAAEPLDVGWVEGRCLSYGDSIAYLPWLDMLHGWLEMSVEDPPPVVRDALRQRVQDLCPDHLEEVYPYLARMLSLPLEDEVAGRLVAIEPEGMKVLTFRAMERVVESAARARPLVLVCEDLHWADPTSLELLEELLGLTDRASLLLVCAFRPYTRHGCWRVRETVARVWRHRHTDVWLEPLSAADSERLVGNLLEVEALPRPLRERILDHAEGNPFYVEEVIRSLINAEAIVQDEVTGYWQAMSGVEDIAIPGTLQGVLMARIDRLQEEAKRVLQLASVIGRIFPYRVLSAIVHEEEARPGTSSSSVELLSRRGLDAHLSTLQREDMVRERARVPELEYMFKHHLTQQAAYNGLLRRERRQFHRQVAEALERLFSERIEEQLGLVAHHWEQAGDQERAIHYLRRAGEQAAAQFGNAEAVGYFTRALDLTPKEDPARRYDLLMARERSHDLQGARKAQMESLVTLEALADDLQDDRRRAEVALRQAWYGIQTSDYPAAIAAARRAVRLAQVAHDVQREAAGYLRLGQAFWDQGDYVASSSSIEQGLALARSVGSRSLEAEGLNNLGYAYLYQGNFDEAIACCERALLIFRELGHRRSETRSLFRLGMVSVAQGDYDEAKDYFVQGARIARELGAQHLEGYSLVYLSSVSVALGSYDVASGYCKEAVRILRETGHSRGEGLALAWLALLSYHQGDCEAAREYSRQALLVGRDAGGRYVQAYALTSDGHALVGLGRLDEAADSYCQALALRRQLREHRMANESLAGLARVALAQGDLDRAQAHVEAILSYLETGTLDGTREPFLVYLTCYRVLHASRDPRAGDVLNTAYRLLQEQAAKIRDEEDRRSFLENVAANREIASEYALVGSVLGASRAGEEGHSLPCGQVDR